MSEARDLLDFYTHAPLAKMLEKYIDFGRLSNRVALATTAAGSS